MKIKPIGMWPVITFMSIVVAIVPLLLFLFFRNTPWTLFAFFDPARQIFAPTSTYEISVAQQIYRVLTVFLFYAVFAFLSTLLYRYGKTGQNRQTLAWSLGATLILPFLVGCTLIGSVGGIYALWGIITVIVVSSTIILLFAWYKTEPSSQKDKIWLVLATAIVAMFSAVYYVLIDILLHGIKM